MKQTSLNMVSVIGRVTGCLTVSFLSSGKFLPSNRGASGKNGCSGSWVVLLMALLVGGTSGGEEPWERTTKQPLLAYLFRFLTKTPIYFKVLPPDYW